MWSSGAVANIKESLKKPGVRFEPIKREPTTKIYKSGERIAIDSEDPEAIQVALQLHDEQQQFKDKQQLLALQAEADGLLDIPIPDDHNINTTTTTINRSVIGKTTKIVLDSGAFITGANVSAYGPDCEYFTIQQVIDELLDENAKFNFQTFPYPITVKIPSNHSLTYINNISKQTGDYYVLSLTDRLVLALCHQLEIETNGDKYIHYHVQKPNDMASPVIPTTGPVSEKKIKQPIEKKPNTITTSPETLSQPTTIDPNAWCNHFKCNEFNLDLLLSEDSQDYNNHINTLESPKTLTVTSQGYTIFPSIYDSYTPSADGTSSIIQHERKTLNNKFILPGFDDGEWLSPQNVETLNSKTTKSSNIAMSVSTRASALSYNQLLSAPTVTLSEKTELKPKKVNKSKGSKSPEDSIKPISLAVSQKQHKSSNSSRILIGGITTDYSMQNVMLQAGLQCLTLDGRAITTIRQYIMGCHACFTLSKDLARGFCPSCGGFTMVRIIVDVDRKGKPHYKWPVNRIYNTRGTIFQISTKATFGVRKGQGKVILREDMLPKPKLKEILIARGERKVEGEGGQGLDEAALFGMVRQFEQKTATYGYGKRNMNISRRRRR